MKRKVSDVIDNLSTLPPDAEVDTVNVWSNGKKIRRWAGQDDNVTWHPPSAGYRRMTAILIDKGAEE